MMMLAAFLPAVAMATATAAAAPANAGTPFKVVTYGTSITARGGWQQPLAKALSQCLGRQVSVQAVGGPGQGSAWGLANAGRVTALKPDLVIVEFAINDADIRNWISPRSSRHNTVKLIERLREAPSHPEVVLMTTHPVLGWKRLLRPKLDAYYDEYRRISKGRGVSLIDANMGWRGLPDDIREDALPDGVHPRPLVFAQAVVPMAKRAICR